MPKVVQVDVDTLGELMVAGTAVAQCGVLSDLIEGQTFFGVSSAPLAAALKKYADDLGEITKTRLRQINEGAVDG